MLDTRIPPMPTVGQTLGPFEIVDKLGEGGMGAVYKARDTRLNRFVALKLMLPGIGEENQQFRRFAQEAQAASALNHPNIITIYDISTEAGSSYIAMEFVPGQTLDRLIAKGGMRTAEVLRLALQIADALGAAAAAGIIHRDLKPSNIMVSEAGLVKLLDFGVAKFFLPGTVEFDPGRTLPLEAEQSLTRQGTLVGTIAYMSPEQAQGLPLDVRSDIFSFGAVLYEMVTGESAFPGSSYVSVLTSILRDEPRPVGAIAADVPRELEAIINRCLRKEPDARFQSIGDARQALLVLREDSESGKVLAPAGRPKRVFSRRASLLMASLLALLAVACFTLVRFGRESHAPPMEPRIVPFASYPGFQGNPAFSRDGNQIAFTWTGGQGEVTHIFAKVIGTDTPLALTSGPFSDNEAAFAPDGRSVAFLRNMQPDITAIYQVSALGGRERLLAQIPAALYPNLEWSSDGRFLVTSGRSDRDKHTRVFVVAASDGGVRILSFGKTGDEFSAALSPNSRALAFTRTEGDTEWGIYVVALDTQLRVAGAARRLNTPSGLNRQATWMADGKELIFVNGGSSTSRLWRVTVDGNKPAQPIALTGEVAYQPAIAPVGNRLAFAHHFNNSNIWSLPVLGPGKVGEAKQIISSARSSYVRPNAIAADGKRFAFESNRSGPYGIWTANLDGSDPAFLFGSTDFLSGSPAWSKDGREVAFDSRKGKHAQIFSISKDGGSPRALTDGRFDSMLPSWSQDGKWVYFTSNRNGGLELFKCSPKGGEPIQITENGGWAGQESPDGKWLYYTRSRFGKSPLVRMPVSGGKEVEVLPGVHERWWAVAEKGVWYLERQGSEGSGGLWGMESAFSDQAELRFLNASTHKTTTVASIPKSPAGGLALSPDGRTLLYSRVDYRAYEIEVVERFQ